MGIVRQIIVLSFFLCVYTVNAQKKSDTLVVDGKMYIYHIVQANETYFSISKKYGVSLEKILLENKNTKQTSAYYKQSLYIPIESTLSERLLYTNRKTKNRINQFNKRVHDDTINIALLLPFYTTKNDSLLSFLSKYQQPRETIYKDSYLALSFFEGVIVAIDSLSRKGIIINLFIFDTENDTNKVKKIIEEGKLKNIDLIFGPVSTKNIFQSI